MIVKVVFDDHVEDGSEPENFTVYGELCDVQRRFICVDSWAYTDRVREHDSNEKRFTILRSAVTEVVELTPKNDN